MPLLYVAGMQIDKWVLDEKIGSPGGEGEVWLVHNMHSREVERALKLRPATSLDDRNTFNELRERFIEEVNALTIFAAASTYIVSVVAPIVEIYSQEGEEFVIFGILLELCKLGDLHQAIEQNSIREYLPTPRPVIKFMINIVTALSAGHRAGRMHCDLKPKNILLAKADGEVIPKLTDFGVSRKLLELPIGRTPGYSAPELEKRGTAATPQSDVFSLGVTFYELFYATVIAKNAPTIKTAAQYRTAGDYISYLTREFQPPTANIDLDVYGVLTLLAEMCNEIPSERPSLENILTFLKTTERKLETGTAKYKPDLPTNKFRWSTQVHNLTEERCYYFFISGGNPQFDIDWIRTDLKTLKLSGYTLLTISGFWDYILRFWTDNSSIGVEDVAKALNRTAKKVMPLVVEETFGDPHKKATADKRTVTEKLQEIERIYLEGKDSELIRLGFAQGHLPDLAKKFRVTTVVEIDDNAAMLPIYGLMVKKAVSDIDKAAKNLVVQRVAPVELSADSISPEKLARNNAKIIVEFEHNDFIKCRATIVNLTSEFKGYGDKFRFSTAFHMAGPGDIVSDDGGLIAHVADAFQK